MLFNTIDFAIFFPLVLLFYWLFFQGSLKLQNLFLVIVSYIFYCFWDWRFLSLIFISSLVDFLVGSTLGKIQHASKRKMLLYISLAFNLGLLILFKYFNFFVETFVNSFALLGTNFNITNLSILLPVGISFYTFQTMSYTLDIYYKRLKPTQNVLAFFAFVSFFPQLVAGPIERASHLLCQFEMNRKFDYNKNVDGLRLILGGLFKKMVIADNCAVFVNAIFEDYEYQSGSTLLVGAIFFAFQIYGDFSGYSDIAIGSSRLLGFDLMKNFNFPYLSQNLSEFWRRWHISLSTWFRDYVYIPLGGNRVSKPRLILNILLVFLLSGLWHGANFTFIVWGFIHALFVLPAIFIIKREPKLYNFGKKGFFRNIINIGGTFLVVVIAWVFFRSKTLFDAFEYLKIIFSKSLFSVPYVSRMSLLLLFLYMVLEWFQRDREHLMDIGFIKSKLLRYLVYYGIVFCILYFAGNLQPFIYFQF